MSIYKRSDSNIWWVNIRGATGKRIRCSTGTSDKKQAELFLAKLITEQWNQEKLGIIPIKYFEDAAIKVMKLAEGNKDYSGKASKISYWRTCFAGRELNSITADEIFDNLPTHYFVGPKNNRRREKLSGATKNRYLAEMSVILNVAYDSGWIERKPKLDKFKEAPIRIRWITKEQAKSLLNSIQLPWMREVTAFALATGARMSEILFLDWAHVDLDKSIAWVRVSNAKSSKPRPLPLNKDALVIVHSRVGKHPKWVFTRDTGVHASDINRKTFDLALERVGIEDFTFHDLRHTWASWHVQAGTPLFTLKELGGWESIEMVKKYAHLNADHLAEYKDSVTFWSRSHENEPAERKKATFKVA